MKLEIYVSTKVNSLVVLIIWFLSGLISIALNLWKTGREHGGV